MDWNATIDDFLEVQVLKTLYRNRVFVTNSYFLYLHVVNTLLHNGFYNPYLSKYSSVSLGYQCLNPHTITSAIDVSTDTSLAINVSTDTSLAIDVSTDTSLAINVSTDTSLAIDVSTDTSLALSMSKRTRAVYRSMSNQWARSAIDVSTDTST